MIASVVREAHTEDNRAVRNEGRIRGVNKGTGKRDFFFLGAQGDASPMDGERDAIAPDAVFVNNCKPLGFHPGLQSRDGNNADPATATEERDLSAPARPCAGCARGRNVTSAIGRRAGRCRERAAFDRQLSERVE